MVTRKPAAIDLLVQFVDDNSSQVLATIERERCLGNARCGDLDTGEQTQEAYAKCVKELGKCIAKNAFK